MLFVAGLLILALGLFSGGVLLLAPLGLIETTAGLTLWVLFPVFTIGGYLLAASAAPDTSLPMLSRATGASGLAAHRKPQQA